LPTSLRQSRSGGEAVGAPLSVVAVERGEVGEILQVTRPAGSALHRAQVLL